MGMMNEIKERPILFTAEEVRATLDRRKTQKRIPIKPQPPTDCGDILGPEMYSPLIYGKDGEEKPGKEIFGIYDDTGEWGIKCPYEKGMSLWVKETWRYADVLVNGKERIAPYYIQYKADGSVFAVTGDVGKEKLCFLSDDWSIDKKFGKWKSPIYMPRWASRINLEITGIRPERVQDISYEDAVAEGTPGQGLVCATVAMLCTGTKSLDEFEKKSRIDSFSAIWDSINGKKHPWINNDYVWRIEFQMI